MQIELRVQCEISGLLENLALTQILYPYLQQAF